MLFLLKVSFHTLYWINARVNSTVPLWEGSSKRWKADFLDIILSCPLCAILKLFSNMPPSESKYFEVVKTTPKWNYIGIVGKMYYLIWGDMSKIWKLFIVTNITNYHTKRDGWTTILVLVGIFSSVVLCRVSKNSRCGVPAMITNPTLKPIANIS